MPDSMPRFHISSDGTPRKCDAAPGSCPLGGEHFDSPAEAQGSYERSMASQTFSSFSKKSKPARALPLEPEGSAPAPTFEDKVSVVMLPLSELEVGAQFQFKSPDSEGLLTARVESVEGDTVVFSQGGSTYQAKASQKCPALVRYETEESVRAHDDYKLENKMRSMLSQLHPQSELQSLTQDARRKLIMGKEYFKDVFLLGVPESKDFVESDPTAAYSRLLKEYKERAAKTGNCIQALNEVLAEDDAKYSHKSYADGFTRNTHRIAREVLADVAKGRLDEIGGPLHPEALEILRNYYGESYTPKENPTVEYHYEWVARRRMTFPKA